MRIEVDCNEGLGSLSSVSVKVFRDNSYLGYTGYFGLN